MDVTDVCSMRMKVSRMPNTLQVHRKHSTAMVQVRRKLVGILPVKALIRMPKMKKSVHTLPTMPVKKAT